MIQITKGERRHKEGTLGAPRPQTCAKGLRPLDSNRRLGWVKNQTICACCMGGKQASFRVKEKQEASQKMNSFIFWSVFCFSLCAKRTGGPVSPACPEAVHAVRNFYVREIRPFWFSFGLRKRTPRPFSLLFFLPW